MAIQPQPCSKPIMRGFRGGAHILAACLAIGLLLFQLASSVISAFDQSYWIGIRSLAAALFPISVALYFGFLIHIRLPENRSRAPVINNYVIFVLWTLILFGLDGIKLLGI